MGEFFENTKQQAKRAISHFIKKIIRRIIKKMIKALIRALGKILLKALGVLITTIGLPAFIIILAIMIVGGAILIIAPSFDWIDEDAPVAKAEIQNRYDQLIKESSSLPEYRPPLKLASAIDAVRIVKGDLDPWEVSPEDIIPGLSPDLTYKTYEDTYEYKTVVVEKYTEYIQTSEIVNTCTDGSTSPDCMEVKKVEKPIERERTTETIEVKKKEKSLLETAHAWDRFDTYYYKEKNLNEPFKQVSQKTEGKKTITVYKRQTKKWELDEKRSDPNYEKFDSVLSLHDFKEEDISLLVESLNENDIHLDGYMGSFFDMFIEHGVGLMVPTEFLPIYQAAAKKYNVDWNVLAAIHYVETSFSTNLNVSSAGAIGHTQWMKCTWVGWSYPGCKGTNGDVDIPEAIYTSASEIRKYGGYGIDGNNNGKNDPWELEDSIYTTAAYLSKNNYKKDKRNAVYSYNHSDAYVDKVLHFADVFGSTSGQIPEQTKGKFMKPTVGSISSPFGPRSLNGNSFHYGIDVRKAGNADPIVAVAEGKVIRSYVSSSYGEAIYIQHNIDGQIWTSVYAHMVKGSRRVQVGEYVQKGQIIGIKGTTGRSTGVHLHFELHKGAKDKKNAVDPIGTGLIQW